MQRTTDTSPKAPRQSFGASPSNVRLFYPRHKFAVFEETLRIGDNQRSDRRVTSPPTTLEGEDGEVAKVENMSR